MTQGSVAAWIGNRFPIYARASLLSLILITPVIFTRSMLGIFDIAKIGLIWGLGATGLSLSLINSIWTGTRPPRTRLVTLGVAFLLATGVATVFSRYKIVALIGTYGRYRGFASLLLFLAIMHLVVRLYWDRPKSLDAIAWASAGAALLVAVYVLLQAAGLDWIRLKQPAGITTTYPRGTVANSNFTGAYLGIVSPFCVYLAITRNDRRSRTLLAAITTLALLAIWYTSTRAGMLAAGAGLGALALAHRRKLLPALKALGVGALLIAVVLGTFVVIGTGGEDSGGLKGALRLDTLGIRANYWKTAWRIFSDHALLGTGPGTFYANFMRYRSPAEGARNGLVAADASHNVFLDRAAESGILGLGTIVLLVGAAFFYAIRRCKALEGNDRLRLVTFSAVLVAYLTQGLFSIDAPTLALVGWVALGGITAIADPKVLSARERQAYVEHKSAARSANRRIGLLIGGVIVCTLVLLIVDIRFLLADAKAKSASEERNPSKALISYSQASRLNPLEAKYHSVAGDLLWTKAPEAGNPRLVNLRFQQALAEYDRALQLRPQWILDIVRVARLHTRWAEASGNSDHFREAERVWQRVLEVDPHDYEVRFHHSENFRSWARASGNDQALRRRQIAELQTSLAMNENQPKAWVRLASAYRATGQPKRAEETHRSYFGHVLTNKEAAAIISAREVPPELPRANPERLLRVILAAAAAIALAALVFFRFPGKKERGRSRFLRRLSVTPAELLGVPAFWSFAVAIPHLGLFFGLPPEPEDVRELGAHLVPAIILLGLAAVGGLVLNPARDSPPGVRSRAWLWILAILAAAMAAAELQIVLAGVSSEIDWSKTLIHLAPVTMTLAILGLVLKPAKSIA